MLHHPIAGRLLALPDAWRERDIFRDRAGPIGFAAFRDRMLRVAGWLLRDIGLRPGERVTLCLPRSTAAAEVIYGVLAAGATYVPLQYRGPPARLEEILRQVKPRLLLTSAEMAVRLSTDGVPVAIVETAAGAAETAQPWHGAAAPTSLPPIEPDAMAAIYFTSGSTGRPKGVLWSHRMLESAVDWFVRCRELGPDDRLLGHIGLHYSPAVDLFYPLAGGCSLHLLADEHAMFAARIADALAADGTTLVATTATTLRLLLEEGAIEGRNLPRLRRLDIMGERLAMPLLRRLSDALPGTALVNVYGATEAFDMAHFAVPRPLPEGMDALPLGRPLGNLEVSLLDIDGEAVAPGGVGEICVRGPCVTPGYLDDAVLTAAKRVRGRADSYRTGDLGMFGEDGLLRLVGRNDQLVKLRGHRFDLGEIEAVLKTHPAVRDAVACACPLADGEVEVRAVVLSDSPAGLPAALARLGRERLPGFAQPRRIEVDASFPLLATGKVDRLALQARLLGRKEPAPETEAAPN
jgi:amino acid adenylation domain-containing protein